MYITETTENVRKLIKEIEELDDINKMRFLIYVFGLLNNNQINNKNESNPDLLEDDNLEIFNFTSLGFSEYTFTIFLQYLAMVYNILIRKKQAYEENGNVLGIELDEIDKTIASKFEKLSFIEKLNVISELIIRYDNETYFESELTILPFDSKTNGYVVAKMIQDYINKLGK